MAIIHNAKKFFLITWPHCDIAKEVIADKLMEKWRIEYLVVSEEKHEDGEPHVHAFIQCIDKKKIPKYRMDREFDLIKQTDAALPPEKEKISFYWLEEAFNEEELALEGTEDSDVPKAGCEVEDHLLHGRRYRRYHPNIETVRSPKDAIKYVKKDGKFVSKGTCPYKEVTSKREMNELLLRGNLNQLVDDGVISIYNLPRLRRALEEYKNGQIQRKFEAKEVYWFYGPTGTGKTREAFKEATEKWSLEETWISHSDDKWYDGYNGQKCVILDDIRASTWGFSNLLRITDRYPIDVPIKGGFVHWDPAMVIITAPGAPREVYSSHATGEPFDGIEQLERRITELRRFGADGTSVQDCKGNEEDRKRTDEDRADRDAIESMLEWK